MQAISDDQQIERLEGRMDRFEGQMEAVRSEARADFRTIIGIQLGMFATMIFGFAGLAAAILLQHL
ncbi:MAG TPA: hypothetical protein VHZ54_07255 [Solirubrobacterales bacterium]|jgi:tetrahydromethanopterin S-methyltransferase subunit G|nr:hypothetical protein [Solirubrobacterales bacterium]